ncbi:MAG: hypothetical protein JO006_09850 [Paucibacter sp.]|nr:hypothetical protein [Roseateles sp.]
MDSDFSPDLDQVSPEDSGWGLLNHVGDAVQREEATARAEALQNQAVMAARAGDVGAACYYLARSLGVSAELSPDAGPLLLFELQAALAALPGETHCELLPSWRPGDAARVAELCQQLALVRELYTSGRRETDRPAPMH